MKSIWKTDRQAGSIDSWQILRGMPEQGGTNMAGISVIDMEETGKNIKRLRKEAGLTVRSLQEIMGFTFPQAIYKWERGTTVPTIDHLVILADVLGISMDRIIIVKVMRAEAGE